MDGMQVKIIRAEDFGIVPDTEIAGALSAMLKTVDAEATEIVFKKGNYRISAAECEEVTAYMTNSMGKEEWHDGETPNRYRFAFDLHGKKNLTVTGDETLFLVDGQATNMRIDGCENITVRGIAFDVIAPNCHLFTVTKATPTKVSIRLSDKSKYEKTEEGFYFVGRDYRKPFLPNEYYHDWDGQLNPGDDDTYFFGKPLLCDVKEITETAPYEFCFKKSPFRKIRTGERYTVVDIRRRNAGIYINDCKNVTLDGISQHYNYGLAVVAQNVENFTVKNSVFAPRANERYLASVADFLQVCMCRGTVTIENCYFEGSGDDCLNVHGHNLKVIEKNGNTVTVRFMHSQSFGFNAFRTGDIIDFVAPKTLLSYGSAVVKGSKMKSAYDIELELDDAGKLIIGDVVENMSTNPDLTFRGNIVNRVMTRGLLLTTGGKIVVENNFFKNTYLNTLLFEGDARSWYESGRVTDLVVKNNVFGKTHNFNAFFNPGTTQNVHKNIRFVGNKFNSAPYGGFLLRGVENVTFEDNTYSRKPRFHNIGAKNVKKDF